MFMLSNIGAVREGLDNKQKACQEKIKTLEGNKQYLERSIKDSENNLRELITQKKSAN